MITEKEFLEAVKIVQEYKKQVDKIVDDIPKYKSKFNTGGLYDIPQDKLMEMTIRKMLLLHHLRLYS